MFIDIYKGSLSLVVGLFYQVNALEAQPADAQPIPLEGSDPWSIVNHLVENTFFDEQAESLIEKLIDMHPAIAHEQRMYSEHTTMTLLLNAILNHRTQLVRFLLKYDLNLESGMVQGNRILATVMAIGDLDVLKSVMSRLESRYAGDLARLCTLMNASNTLDGTTPLMLALQNKRTDNVLFFLQSLCQHPKPDFSNIIQALSSTNHEGETAILLAAKLQLGPSLFSLLQTILFLSDHTDISGLLLQSYHKNKAGLCLVDYLRQSKMIWREPIVQNFMRHLQAHMQIMMIQENAIQTLAHEDAIYKQLLRAAVEIGEVDVVRKLIDDTTPIDSIQEALKLAWELNHFTLNQLLTDIVQHRTQPSLLTTPTLIQPIEMVCHTPVINEADQMLLDEGFIEENLDLQAHLITDDTHLLTQERRWTFIDATNNPYASPKKKKPIDPRYSHMSTYFRVSL